MFNLMSIWLVQVDGCAFAYQLYVDAMNHTNTDVIRKTIEIAQRLEARHHTLETYLDSVWPRLHKAIQLPEHEPGKALLGFVVRYIEQAPEVLDTLAALMEEAAIYDSGKVFIEIAANFFLRPPELVREHSGLHALVDKAYLAHRMVEEVNDRLMLLCDVPLAPIDMTLANVIVHELLGEDFANQLDLAVHYAVEALFQPDNLKSDPGLAPFLGTQTSQLWRNTLEGWPRLAEDSAISLLLGEPETSPAVH